MEEVDLEGTCQINIGTQGGGSWASEYSQRREEEKEEGTEMSRGPKMNLCRARVQTEASSPERQEKTTNPLVRKPRREWLIASDSRAVVLSLWAVTPLGGQMTLSQGHLMPSAYQIFTL